MSTVALQPTTFIFTNADATHTRATRIRVAIVVITRPVQSTVRLPRNEFEMLDVLADPIAAGVVDLHTVWDRPVLQFPCDTMCETRLASVRYVGVTVLLRMTQNETLAQCDS
jgi:hypothetical protein